MTYVWVGCCGGFWWRVKTEGWLTEQLARPLDAESSSTTDTCATKDPTAEDSASSSSSDSKPSSPHHHLLPPPRPSRKTHTAPPASLPLTPPLTPSPTCILFPLKRTCPPHPTPPQRTRAAHFNNLYPFLPSLPSPPPSPLGKRT